jgi:uncharacterized protein YxjI
MLTKTNYLIKEHVSFLKLVDKYDKETVSGFKKYARLLVKKHFLPTTVEIKSAADDTTHYRMEKPAAFLRVKVNLFDAEGNALGFYKSRILSFGGRFDVFKPDETPVAEIKGSWTGWDFKFSDMKGNEIGTITKKWAGIGKELFTNADNYIISLNPTLKGNVDFTALLIMAGLAIDIVFKEKQ